MIAVRIPELQNGDCLSVEEFMLRYEAMPGVKAELVDGEVFMASPVSWSHGSPNSDLITWAGVYKSQTPGVDRAENVTVLLDDNTVLQPDLVMVELPEFGGKIEFTNERYVAGSPELVVEVSVSTVSLDMNRKKKAYQRNGVNEYIVWRVDDNEIDWFILKNGRYQSLPADADGITRSRVFPGLWLDRPAMLAYNLARVLEVVGEGVKSPEHAKYVGKRKK